MGRRPVTMCSLLVCVCSITSSGPFQVGAADSTEPAATPEPTFSSNFYVYNVAGRPIDVSMPNENGFWHSLEVGNASAAVSIISVNIAPAVASGKQLTSLHD